MNLNHLDLQVSDVQAGVLFFERCLGFSLTSSRNSPAIAILTDQAGFSLVLQRSAKPVYPEGFHIGCIVDSVDAVVAFHAKARAQGHRVSDVHTNNRGTMVYCQAGDVLVEVSCRKPG